MDEMASCREITELILKKCTIEIIILLNPDGALKFTRENALNIDLNRDAVAKKAIESKILRKTLKSSSPHFCFNLHDQRSIFNVSGTEKPANRKFCMGFTETSVYFPTMSMPSGAPDRSTS